MEPKVMKVDGSDDVRDFEVPAVNFRGYFPNSGFFGEGFIDFQCFSVGLPYYTL